MSSKRNIALVTIAVLLSLAIYMTPDTLSVQSNSKRLLALTTFNTNPVRTASVDKFCVGISRSTLISTDQKSQSQGYKNVLANTFKVNGNTLFNKLTNKQTGDAITDIQADATAFGLFIGFFVLGLIMLLFSWSFLVCCCCCPGCCPSKCCQKNENQQYTKCQLYWPSIFLILLLLVVVITTAMGLAKASKFKTGLNNLTCAAAIMFDDIINGNVTADGQSFFIGVNKLSTQLGNLNTNYSIINGNITGLSTNLGTIVTNAQNGRDKTRLVPKNTATDGNAVIQYTTGFDNLYSSTNPKINSAYPSILGSTGNGGLIGALYIALDGLYTTLNNIKTNSANFATSSSAFNTNIGTINTNLNNFKTNLNDLDNNLKSALSILDAPKQLGTLAIQLFYGVALGLSVLTLLGVVMMTFCDKYKCRYLMYFSCFILFFFALLGFFIAIIFSIFVPLIYWSCDWFSVTFSSTANFNTNIGGLISDTQTKNYIAPCIQGGTGDLFSAVASASDVTTLNNLRDSLKNASTFNSATQVSLLSNATTAVHNAITSFTNGVTPDITDTTAIGVLVNMANRNGITGCAVLNTDSFVMSMSNTTFTTCQGTAGTNTTNTTCTSKANFVANGAPCQGCIDTTLISNNYYVGQARGQWKTDLIAKYTSGTNTCAAPFTVTFGNVWDNYYYVKVNEPTVNFLAIQTRWVAAKTDIDTVINTNLPAVNGSMGTIMNALSSTVDGITNPTFGLIAGMNCLIIGQDISTFISSICVSNFNTLYITRLVSGISSFAILFALCCIVCSGVRHFKHSERKDKISPNFMGGKNSFEDTDAAFRP